MKRSVLGSYLSSILLHPQPGEPGGAPPAPEKVVRGTNAGDLSPDTINALAGDLGLDPALFGTPKAAPASNSPAPAATPAATPPAPNAPNLNAAPAAAATPAAAAAAPATPPAPAELTAEQTTWLEQRAAATTPEAPAELDAKAPVFTDEQWTAAEALLNTAPAAATPPATDLQAQLTAAQTEANRIKAEADAQSKRLAEIEAENARLKTQPVAIAPMSPLMAATPEQLAQAERNQAQLKQWCLANWDGTAEVPASGDQPAVPAYSAQQVRAAFARADDQLTRVIPAAREYAAQFESENALAKQVYPELFDAQSPHCQTRENILRRLPGLRAGLPQISTVIGDAIVGEVVRGLMAGETRTAEAKALAEALVKAAPALAKLMPGLASPAKGAARQLKLTAKPVVPLARPSGGQRSIPRPASGKGAVATPNLAAFAKAAGTENENDALLALVKSQLPGVPTIDPKTEA